jgi:inner membrane protein
VSLAVAALSHGFLDALSSYSYGVGFFAPFTQQRYRFPWTPLGSSTGSLAGQLVQEALVVLLPAILLAWLAFKIRGRAPSPQVTPV